MSPYLVALAEKVKERTTINRERQLRLMAAVEARWAGVKAPDDYELLNEPKENER